MVEADIHLRLLLTSILGIWNVFEVLFCCLKGIFVHPYTVTLAKLAPCFGLLVHLRVEIMPLRHGWGWYPPQIASHIHSRHIQCVWGIVLLSQEHMDVPLYLYTSKGVLRFWNLGVTCGVKMMPLLDGWGWYPPQTASHIHIRHVKCVWGIILLSQGHIGAPLYSYTS